MENEKEVIKTDLEKLKESNAEFEKELIKAREMKAERQKLEAEQLLGSSAGQPIPVVPAKVETPKEYATRVMSGGFKE